MSKIINKKDIRDAEFSEVKEDIKDLMFTFKNLPEDTRCWINPGSPSGIKVAPSYRKGKIIFECRTGDIVTFENYNYETLLMYTENSDNGKVFDMDKEFDLYNPNNHNFIVNFLRWFKL